MKIGPFSVIVSRDVPADEVWFATPEPLKVEIDGADLRVKQVLRINGKIIGIGAVK